MVVLNALIVDLCSYAGDKTKMEAHHADTLAMTFFREYSHIKITEYVEFFANVKSGRYGHFYGAVDPITIGDMFRQYYEERKLTMAKFADEDTKVQIDESAQSGISADIHKLQVGYKLAKCGLRGPFGMKRCRDMLKLLNTIPYLVKRGQARYNMPWR